MIARLVPLWLRLWFIQYFSWWRASRSINPLDVLRNCLRQWVNDEQVAVIICYRPGTTASVMLPMETGLVPYATMSERQALFLIDAIRLIDNQYECADFDSLIRIGDIDVDGVMVHLEVDVATVPPVGIDLGIFIECVYAVDDYHAARSS